jgi:hypothetical protein
MPFTRPAIHVYQKLVSVNPSTATPFFELCVVGPSYQVLKSIAFPNYDAAAAYESIYVDQLPGTVVDKDSVVVTLKDSYMKIWPSTSALEREVEVALSGALSTISVKTADFPAYSFTSSAVRIGDIVKVTYTDASVTPSKVTKYTSFVQEINTVGDIVTLKRNIPAPTVDEVAVVTIERPTGSDIVVAPSLLTVDGLGIKVTVQGSLTTTVSNTSYTITRGSVKVDYRALRTYLAGDFLTINNMSDVRANLGDVDADNPLATACGIVFSNANVTFKVLPVETDDNEGYIKALDLLSTNEKVYVIVPLTQDKDVVSAYANHCTTMSTPEKSKWRITYANLRMPQNKVMVDRNDGEVAKGAPAQPPSGTFQGVPATNYVKDIANGMFITNSTRVGDFVDVYDYTEDATLGDYQYSLKIKELLNDTVCETYSDRYVKTDEGYVISTTSPTIVITANAPVSYEVTRVLTPQGISEAMVDVAKSFSNKRLRLVQPDVVMLNINSVDYIMPGYYLCVAYGAMRAGFPPHQGFTTLGVGGIKRIFRSNKYFKDTQLDEMAGGGVFWVIQDEPEALPYCIYQTTTDTTQLETIEDSVVATIDFASKFYKDNLKAVLGRFNVNEISVKYVSAVIKDVTDKMLRMSYPYIGSIILSGQLKTITTSADKIIPTVVIKVPFPVNAVDLYLEV